MTAKQLNLAILGKWQGYTATLEITPDMLTVTLPPPVSPHPQVYHWAYRIKKCGGRFMIELGAVGHTGSSEPVVVSVHGNVLDWGGARYRRVQ